MVTEQALRFQRPTHDYARLGPSRFVGNNQLVDKKRSGLGAKKCQFRRRLPAGKDTVLVLDYS